MSPQRQQIPHKEDPQATVAALGSARLPCPLVAGFLLRRRRMSHTRAFSVMVAAAMLAACHNDVADRTREPSPPSAAASAEALAAETPLVLADDPALPGGKAHYVVTMGDLHDGSTANWVRLGTYDFRRDGTVKSRMWVWTQRTPKAREGTNTTPDASCTTKKGEDDTHARQCEVLTAGGFTADPTESKAGTFTLRTGADGRRLVHITWTFAQTWSEQWYVDVHPKGALAKLEYQFNTFATYGYGYGSNADWDERRSMAAVHDFQGNLLLDGATAAHLKVTTTARGTFDTGAFRECTGTTWCLTRVAQGSSKVCNTGGGCPNYGQDGKGHGDGTLQYFIQKLSSYDRRDTLWHWCTCLAREHKEFCYTGNSHVKPMLQIIDDAGGFWGWVGAEASFAPGSAPRENDMLGTFRIAAYR